MDSERGNIGLSKFTYALQGLLGTGLAYSPSSRGIVCIITICGNIRPPWAKDIRIMNSITTGYHFHMLIDIIVTIYAYHLRSTYLPMRVGTRYLSMVQECVRLHAT